MADILQAPINTRLIINKLKTNLDNITSRLANSDNPSILTALSEINSAFNKFFDTLQDPQFVPELFLTGDTPRSELYNKNLKSIFDDLDRFYKEVRLLTDAQLKSFNFSQVLLNSITHKANSLASTVLDLNILSGFTRGDTLVAGDDFKSQEFIDVNVGTVSSRAEILTNGAGIGLARAGVNDITRGARIEVVPLAPSSPGGSSVNTEPTPGNFQRFYEGCYYSFLGTARPEGGRFNIKYLVDPSSIKETEVVTDDPNSASNSLIDNAIGTRGGTNQPNPFDDKPPKPDNTVESFFLELGATEEEKRDARKKMIDGDASTFWECEYLFQAPAPLVDDVFDSAVVDKDSNLTNDQDSTDIQSGSIRIDLIAAERRAQQYDTIDQDLLLDLVITLNSLTNINFIAINPILFGNEAFPEIEDIATAASNDGEFVTVDGWDRIRFPKTITPEANEFLTDSQVGLSLSPNRSNYLGQGIFPFPVRVAKKVKIRIRVKTPVPALYERTYVLLKKQIDVTTTTTTTTKRGLFR